MGASTGELGVPELRVLSNCDNSMRERNAINASDVILRSRQTGSSTAAPVLFAHAHSAFACPLNQQHYEHGAKEARVNMHAVRCISNTSFPYNILRMSRTCGDSRGRHSSSGNSSCGRCSNSWSWGSCHGRGRWDRRSNWLRSSLK